MNRIFTIFAALIVATSVFAQSPEILSYQAVVRNTNRELVADQQVGMQISILQGSADGAVVYMETQTPTTNANGLVTIEIGAGISSDDFSTIDWANGPYFIKTETDRTGGTNYTLIATSQLASVPYALFANSSETTNTITGTITESQISDLQNYLTSEVDPVFTAWDRSTGISITESQISDLQNYLTSEVDPTYTASQATNITATDITNLGNLSGTNTGDQNLSGLARSADVIELDNTSPFTPDADYEPATKRYVDDAIDAVTSEHYIGELFGGGIIFWLTPDGTHGLIASLDDLDGGSGVAWGSSGTTVGATSMTDGEANTAIIIAASPPAGSAAVLCNTYSNGGHSDWYLPSNRELFLMVGQDYLIDYILDNDGNSSTNGFTQEYNTTTNGQYWGSTEFGNDSAWVYRFYSTNSNVSTKSDNRRVRAVRSF